MKNFKLSIIIATFNAGYTLKNALNSVLNQSFLDWECIVVDSASKDNTLSIIQKYVALDTRFRYISEPDRGIYDAFNKGLKLAQGEWIYYLGADDILLLDGLEKLFAVNDLEKYDVVFGDLINLYPDGSKQPVKHLKVNAMPYRVPGGHQATITRKSIMDAIGGFDISLKVASDKDLFIRLYLSGYKFKAVDDISIAYFSIGGTSTEGRHATFDDNIKIWKKNDLGFSYLTVLLLRYLYADFKHFFKIKKALGH